MSNHNISKEEALACFLALHNTLTWVTKQTVWKVATPEAMPVASLLPARRELELRGRERKARIGEMIERVEQTISPPMLPSLSNIKQPESGWT